MKISIEFGDIIRVQADALITAVNSGGEWYGPIDRRIYRVAGRMFHDRLRSGAPLVDGMAVIAGHSNSVHLGSFTDVIFVVDDLKQPLREIVYAALKAAADAGYKTVSLPMMRTGVTLGFIEKSKKSIVDELIAAVAKIRSLPSNTIDTIIFVVHRDPQTEALLKRSFL